MSFNIILSLSLSLSLQYKYSEGSGMERHALYHGYEELMKVVNDIIFSIPETEYGFGQDVTLTVKATNKAPQHLIKGTIQCKAVTYTGWWVNSSPFSVVHCNCETCGEQ